MTNHYERRRAFTCRQLVELVTDISMTVSRPRTGPCPSTTSPRAPTVPPTYRSMTIELAGQITVDSAEEVLGSGAMAELLSAVRALAVH